MSILKKNSSLTAQFSMVDLFAASALAVFILFIVYIFLFPSRKPEPLVIMKDIVPPPAIMGQNYIFTIPVSGGSGERSFTLSGTLPRGLDYDPHSGTIYGVVDVFEADDRSFSLYSTVLDQSGGADSTEFDLQVFPMSISYDPEMPRFRMLQTQEPLPDGRVNTPYMAVLGAEGGVQPYLWSVVAGSLPPGMRLESGTILGSATKSGKYEFTVRVRHTTGSFTHRGSSGERSYSWEAESTQRTYTISIMEQVRAEIIGDIARVGEPHLVFLAVFNTLYHDIIELQGEVPGMTLTSDGRALEGVPTHEGEFEVSYRISHLGIENTSGVRTISILPQLEPFRLGVATFQAWLGEQFEVTIPHRGGVEPVALTIWGELPEGLRYRDGSIEGIPTQYGLTTIRIVGEDSTGESDEVVITIRVGSRY
jgi:hypothetical protein